MKGTGTPEEFEEITLGSLRKAVQDGDIDEGTFLAGAVSGLVNEKMTCKAIIDEIIGDAKKLLKI